MGDANAVRGEVDLVLDGQSFVLRPSYTAIVAMEKKTGLALLQLTQLAEQGVLTQEAQAIVVTELVRGWGREQVLDEYSSASERSRVTAHKGVNVDTIAELLFPVGVMAVQPRIAIVLGLAATGGCLPSGEAKATGMMTPEIPVAD
ncbi:hypothetical protein [Sphingomonas sp. Leaf257]|jgi:hypothetical protein|uniref:hypothetical protein n=1 Tax=Sphingomonas sp. Leaf257 TaxID=1736309 RepID=UPI0006F90B82|nr:hypothetical protein [Sphingomonas sp. Leaf257]KQO51409.1 hypothetical protein ASF14_07885 [Sphingomonas sp. Leaf257]